MDFKGNYRIEAVYFEKLKRDIAEVKRLMDAGASEEARTLLENAVDVDGAVLLLYRNLGELWADLADKLAETNKALQDLAEKTEKYHDELNEKIDEINNYIMGLVRELDERLTAVEQDLATMQRVKIYDLANYDESNTLYVLYKGEQVIFQDLVEDARNNFVVFRDIQGNFYFIHDLGTVGTPALIIANSVPMEDLTDYNYHSVEIHPDVSQIAYVNNYVHVEDALKRTVLLTFSSQNTGVTDVSKNIIAQDFYKGYNVKMYGDFAGIEIMLTVTQVFYAEVSGMHVFNIKALGYDPDNLGIYMVDMPFTGGEYDFNIEVFSVIKTVGDGLAFNGPELYIDRAYIKEKYTVVFSALSSSATMTRKETGETLTFNSLAAAVSSGNYHITAEATGLLPGQQNYPSTYLFTLENYNLNDGFGNRYVFFHGWRGSGTGHEFGVYDAGITYGYTSFEITP